MLSKLNGYVRDHRYAAGALLALAAAEVFSGVLSNGLVYDDGKQLLENPFVRNPHLWWRIFSGSVWSCLGEAAETNFYRPLITDVVASGPAMFDTARLDRARGVQNSDPDPPAQRGRPAAGAGLRTASLDEVLCISGLYL